MTPTDNRIVNGHFEDANADNDGLAPWDAIGETKRSGKDVTAWDGEHYAVLKVDANGGPALYQSMGGPPPSRRDFLQARGSGEPNGELALSSIADPSVRH